MSEPDERKAPAAPAGLGDAGRRLWEDVSGPWVLRPDELVLLERSCRALDTVGAMDDALAEAGYLTAGSKGQLVTHPLVSERRQHELLLARLLRQLGLPDAPGKAAQRSAGARRAARARWSA